MRKTTFAMVDLSRSYPTPSISWMEQWGFSSYKVTKSHGEDSTLATSFLSQGKGELDKEIEINFLSVLKCIAERCNCEHRNLQAYLRDIAGSFPDHCNKVNAAIKRVTYTFWFSSMYQSYVYIILYSIKSTIALNLRYVHALIKKQFIAKTC